MQIRFLLTKKCFSTEYQKLQFSIKLQMERAHVLIQIPLTR